MRTKEYDMYALDGSSVLCLVCSLHDTFWHVLEL